MKTEGKLGETTTVNFYLPDGKLLASSKLASEFFNL
jgi:hypothetical protein